MKLKILIKIMLIIILKSKELKETISVLENQLNSHLEYNQKLENNITEMLEKLKEKGYEI